jgi:hypothetical protein
MGAVHCWMARYEAEGHEDWGGWVMAQVEGKADWPDDLWERGHAICLLPDGHGGAHEYTPEDEIVLVFAPEGGAGG